jgi:hypothetical protein
MEIILPSSEFLIHDAGWGMGDGMIGGLEDGIEALTDIRRIFESNSLHNRVALVDQIVRSLRDSEAPFLIGLAEAIDDGLINSLS